jgi:hypothetical protein
MAGTEFIAYKAQSGLGSFRFLFSATPYEGGAAQNNVIYTYDSDGRRDMRYLGSSASGNGWQHNFEIVGRKARRDTVWGGRAAGVKLTQEANTNVDPLDGGFLPLGHSTSIKHLYGIIKDDSGINTQFLESGIQRTRITATTPDYFLAKQRTPRLPYLLAAIAQKERSKWGTLVHTIADLGFMPTTGEDPTLHFDKDPLSGFGAYFDEASGSYIDVLSPHPANEQHFLGSLSAAYALQEYFNNHVRMNGSPIGQTMAIEIIPDSENAIITLDIAEGSPHNAALSTLREGNYRYWWDYNCGMHLVPDYCTPFYGGGVSAGTLNLAKIPGLVIEVSPGPPVGYTRVNRVYAEGQWSSPAATSDPLARFRRWKRGRLHPTKLPTRPARVSGRVARMCR